MNRYSTEEKQQAIDLYFKNGCNMKKTVRELGYGSATGILRWLRETVPDKVSKTKDSRLFRCARKAQVQRICCK